MAWSHTRPSTMEKARSKTKSLSRKSSTKSRKTTRARRRASTEKPESMPKSTCCVATALCNCKGKHRWDRCYLVNAAVLSKRFRYDPVSSKMSLIVEIVADGHPEPISPQVLPVARVPRVCEGGSCDGNKELLGVTRHREVISRRLLRLKS